MNDKRATSYLHCLLREALQLASNMCDLGEEWRNAALDLWETVPDVVRVGVAIVLVSLVAPFVLPFLALRRWRYNRRHSNEVPK